MKILVLGAGGMAGHVISLHLREIGHDVDTLSAKNKLDGNTLLVDVTNLDNLKTIFEGSKYDAIINCIGLLVQQSEERKDLSTFINSFLPHYLENRFKDTDTKIIHLSTDCVFSGKNPPYSESSAYDGELFYDRTKALGEIINEKDLTFRMSIIGPDMHPDGIGLFNWFYKQRGEISGYTTAIWNGITTIELAKGIAEALEQKVTGLYHLVPRQNITKYDLLQTFKKVFERDDIGISPSSDVVLDKTLVNTRKDFNFIVSDYRTMVTEMREWIKARPDYYPHYILKENYEEKA